MSTRSGIGGQSGSMAVLMATLLSVIVVLAGIVAVDVGTLLRGARVVSTAADGAALAAASALQQGPFLPRTAADRIARANGASLTACDCDHAPVTVTVALAVDTRLLARIGITEVRATATAKLVPHDPSGEDP